MSQVSIETNRGVKFVAELPVWWDDRGRIAVYYNTIIIAHPEHTPMTLVDGEWKNVEYLP